MAINARDAFNSALSLFSSLYEDMNPTDLPEGLSPDNQDVWFLPGSVSTRPAVSRDLATPVAGSPNILSVEDYPVPSGAHVGVFIDSTGAVWQRNSDGTKTQLLSVNGTGIQFKAENAFNKQFYAYYNATMAAAFSLTPFVGVDIPRYFDGTNVWRVTQDAPGAPPSFSNVTIAASSLTGNITRTLGIVSAQTATNHNLQPGYQIVLTGQANVNIGGGIAAISRDGNGLVTVQTTTAHGEVAGALVCITGVTDTSFNQTSVAILSVIDSTHFTVAQTGASATSSGGNVQEIWNGTFIVSAVTSTTFQYFQLGPTDTQTATGTVTPKPLVTAGARSAVVMFKSFNGAITAPSIPVQLSGGGTSYIQANNIPIGPSGTAQRIIAFTPAAGSDFYYITPSLVPASNGNPPLLVAGTIINDNTTTSAILDFADSTLTAGTQIDIAGNNLFNQVVLAPCLGVIEYQGRLAWWGEINNLKNLINMGFDGGYTTQTTTDRAGSGANDGGAGTAWTNPNNVTSTTLYADLSLAALASSQHILCEAFGFAVSGALGSIGVSFQTYGTISGAGSLRYDVQLLKAGVPFGPVQSLILPASAGSSGAPLNFSTTFSSAGLTASDINNAAFGVQIKVTEFEVAATSTCHIRNVQISVVTPNLFPLGWSSVGTSGGTGLLVDLGNPGFCYQMTSAGGAVDCLIWQNFYQDYYGAPIWIPGRQYLVRMLAKTTNPAAAGNLVVEIGIGPGGGFYIANIPANTLKTTFQWVTATITALPTTPVAGSNLFIYLNGVTSSTVITIDEVEIVDSLQSVLSQQLRTSYFGNEFGYDIESGVIGLSSYTAGEITACFEQRGTLYALTDQSHGDMIRIQNNGSTEPFDWPIDRFAQKVDCAGPGAIDTGEGVAWWAGQSGLRIFSGDQPKKISQERQPTWDRINWAATLAVWVKNDPLQRVLYVGLPLDANTSVSEVEPMSYRSVNTALEPADPLHISFSGKLICSDLCRKWTRWTLPMNCAAMLTSGNSSQIVFGAGFGYLYSLSFSKFTDDDYGTIASYYTTYFHWNHEMEQGIPQLGLHRKIYAYLSAYVTGIGNLTITPLVDSLNNPWQPKTSVFNPVSGLWESGAAAAPISQQLSTQLDHDLDWRLNVLGDRVAFKISPTPLDGGTDAYFNLQHLVVAGRMDRVMPVRGAYL